jgi:hypothetical protein
VGCTRLTIETKCKLRDLMLPPPYKRDLHSSGMLLLYDVSVNLFLPSSRVLSSPRSSTPQNWSNTLYRNVGDYQSTLRNIPEERESQVLVCCNVKANHIMSLTEASCSLQLDKTQKRRTPYTSISPLIMKMYSKMEVQFQLFLYLRVDGFTNQSCAPS